MPPNPSEPVFCFSVLADAAPSSLSRVLDVFALYGLVPSRCHSELAAGGRLAIDLQVAGVAPALAEKLARRVERVISVSHVLLAEKQFLDAA
jgi:acetolactate synthase regulatory subunit